MHSGTANSAELNQFKAAAHEWWDAQGKFRPLHEMLPLRMQYILDVIASPQGTTILDVGCGGGLTAEPLARLGAQVTAIDAESTTIDIAKEHAAAMGLSINYQTTTIEEHAKEGHTYNTVLAFEIIEHVDNVSLFCATLASLVKPGGTLILSTLNRTPQSYLKAILAAEYILRWIPKGTHTYQKFMKPAEMVHHFEEHGLKLHNLQGLSYTPWTRSWSLTPDVSVNYFASFTR